MCAPTQVASISERNEAARREFGAGKPRQAILADSRAVLTRLDNNEINGCVAEVASWNGALRWLEEQARVRYPKAVHGSPAARAGGLRRREAGK
jgi:hypothetical protein